MGEVYKQAFTEEIQKSGINGLIKMLSDKNKRLAANPPQQTPSPTRTPAL
jgi:hypothetical protein